MKKYILSFIAFAFIFGTYNIYPAHAAFCALGDVFNSATGERCLQDGSSAVNSNQQLQIGSRGENVRVFQQMLANTGFLFGKVDGIYGPITADAAARYYKAYPPARPAPLPLSNSIIDTVSLPNGKVGESYTATINASQGTSDYRWMVTSGSLPQGLSLTQYNLNCIKAPCPNQNGATIYGTPTTSGNYSFTVQLTSGGYMTSRDFTIRINSNDSNPNQTPTPTPSPLTFPRIDSVTPTSGPVGTEVTISGIGLSGGSVNFAGHSYAVRSSSDSELTFTIPTTLNNCNSARMCTEVYMRTNPGKYDISVTNNGYTSNSVGFIVTGDTLNTTSTTSK